MKLRALLVAGLLAATVSGCSDEDTYTYCETYSITDDNGDILRLKECCKDKCEEDFDGDIDCSTTCSCEVQGEHDDYPCPPRDRIHSDSLNSDE